ncbi:MAG: phenylacetate-CoA oxygenase subunit PaaI [Bacteroidetes bacterium]|nr:phenylacetate-CoA oxygenase subunit PaaI [Bacteroidota bacterium]
MGKAIKEVKYHFRHSSECVIRFGNGTDESMKRAQNAINELWRFTDDMFVMNETDEELISTGITFGADSVYTNWKFTVDDIYFKRSQSFIARRQQCC